MVRTLDLSVSVRTQQYVVAGLVCATVLSPLLMTVTRAVTAPAPVVAAVAVSSWLALTVLWVRRLGGSDDGSVWAAIPRWQYGGRHAGSGALGRADREDALGRDEE